VISPFLCLSYQFEPAEGVAGQGRIEVASKSHMRGKAAPSKLQ